MSYISEMRKYVGHAPVMAVAAMGILYSKEKGLLLEKRLLYCRSLNILNYLCSEDSSQRNPDTK